MTLLTDPLNGVSTVLLLVLQAVLMTEFLFLPEASMASTLDLSSYLNELGFSELELRLAC